MKTLFQLEEYKRGKDEMVGGTISIIGKLPQWKPYVSIKVYHRNKEGKNDHRGLFVKDKDLERLAINILKSIKSKHLK